MDPITPNTNTLNTDQSHSFSSSTVPTPSITPNAGSKYFNNSIFWIEVEKIVPNPYQPRREFDPHALKDLSESIRMYGLLQPLVVTRREIIKEDGGLVVQYELISGERRLRASKLAGLIQVPVIIRAGEEDARVKLELAIIENLQREDLNAVDRARSFQRLADEFGLKHVQIAEKMGKSREYVTNSIRLLSLPEHMLTALSEKRISEGHTRPLLMLVDRPEEQETLFKEIVFKKITVREAESIARRVAVERTRKKDQNAPDPEIREFETKLNQALGTRVMIEKKEQGGKVVIDFFSNQDLRHLLDILEKKESPHAVFNSIPEYIPGSIQAAAAKGSISPEQFSNENNERIVSIANSLHNATSISNQNFQHIEFEKVHTLEDTNERAFGSHLVPSANSLSATLSTVSNDATQTYVQPGSVEVSADEIGTYSPVDGSVAPASVVADQAYTPVDDSTPSDAKDDEDLYSIKNFSI